MSARSLSLIGVGVAVGSLAAYYVWRLRNTTLQWEEVGHVSALMVYPLKSGRGISVDRARATSHGLETDNGVDRSFVVVLTTPEKKIQVTSTMLPVLSTIVTSVQEGHASFSSTKSDRSTTVDLKKTLQSKPVSFYMMTTHVHGFDCGEEVAEWLQNLLYADTEPSKRPVVQMVFVGSPEACKTRALKPDIFPFPQFQDTDLRVYHDACAYLLTSTSSLEDLNTRLETPVTMSQLRGNIVVTGQPAFAEDHWAYVRIGENVVLRTLKPREACFRVNVNPGQGIVQNEVLEVMKKYRVPPMHPQLAKHWSQKPFFGLHMGLDEGGKISIGDKVYAVKKKPHWLL